MPSLLGKGTVTPMDDTGDPLETLEALIEDGWEVTEVTSDDEAVHIALTRGAKERTVRLGRRHARRLLVGGPTPLGRLQV